ncbi:MAG: hypothetical protein ACFFFB_12475 [Candidatus Heimdallarchaeota archaeon]
MELDEKKIYLILSPHVNYYHSYRGDSRGESGFGVDIRFMKEILEQLDKIENEGLCGGKIPICWDYGDLFWTIQLQNKYQKDVLENVKERCRVKKDEVLIGSWGNAAQSILDSEEFQTDQNWNLVNSMNIGLKQLFPGRIAPYSRPQETMFTQGLIEEYSKAGIKGIVLYYSVYPFDSTRPFINPRLNWNQMFNPIKFKSVISDASIIMIPAYSFGDIVDYYSIKKWFELIREKQTTGEISEHALLFLNYDMDADPWTGIKLPKFLQWMPKTRGIREFAEAVHMYDYIEFGTLLDTIPKLKIYGETTLREDVADGLWNGYYNWAQKYENTIFWTRGQRSRWLKCISDSLIDTGLSDRTSFKINKLIRENNDSSESYLKNKILFASTTNFGLSMPFLHPHRYKTAMIYMIKAYKAAKKAANLAIKEKWLDLINSKEFKDYYFFVFPVVNRGITENEQKPIKSDIYVKSEIPQEISEMIRNENLTLLLGENNSKEVLYSIYLDDNKQDTYIEAFLPESSFNSEGLHLSTLKLSKKEKKVPSKSSSLKATISSIENKHIKIILDKQGKINSVYYKDEEFACHNFLESAVMFGKKAGKRFSASYNKISIVRDGSDNFSVSIKIEGRFELIKGQFGYSELTITLYRDIPSIFINVEFTLPDIKGESISVDGSSSVQEFYDIRWKEVMPCEIKPNILGKNKPLRIWKHNFLGHSTYFDLDMKEVDAKNADIDCLVANISDGWMALTNGNKGILVCFNSLKAANFAFSPIKIRGSGFGDIKEKAQQIRINPFGTYHGNMLHYWTNGTSYAQKMIPKVTSTYRSTAPTFNGKTISFDLIISPYQGNKPPEQLIAFANHYSLSPLIIIGNQQNPLLHDNYSKFDDSIERIIDEYELKDIMNLSYLNWVDLVNKDYKSRDMVKKSRTEHIGIGTMLKMFIDGIKGR